MLMATRFPQELDTFDANHQPGQPVPSGCFNLLEEAVAALEQKVGVNNSNDEGSLDYIVRSLGNALQSLYGTSNQSINLFKALNQQIDTRSLELVYDTNGNLTTVYEKDGGTIVKTTTLGYDSNGNLSTVTEQVGGRTITTTLNYDTNGNLTGITRQVS
jgi:YD repeat-containing protein